MSNFNGVEIAIIGMSGQFPGAGDIDKLWNNLKEGVESVAFFSDEELLAEGAREYDLQSPQFVKANAYLEEKEFFDADFFGYLPAEAALMDPQLRMFHEHCWRLLETAGYGILNKDNNKIGLFAGATSNNNWENYAILANMAGLVEDYTASQLRDITFLCSRISYLLDLQGPSVFINTACSTSLVAVQRACMSLLTRECNMAIAGGICINNYSRRGYLYQEGMISSPDGHCRPFDSEAAGTVSGEGVGVVLLKRLADALKDGDTIQAVIRGSAVNNDGHQKMSFTAPGVEGQYKAIVKAMQMAKIPAESISYIEAHGTGTRLGDPIEVEALNRAFAAGGDKKFCALGSVKSNIGHLDAAAGIAGLIKTVLALRHRQLPPTLHYREANPKIDFAGGPFYVNTELREWKHAGYPLRAGISSFGIGGTNAHVILEEAPAAPAPATGRSQELLLISGRTAGALERNTRLLIDHLSSREGQQQSLGDIAYTLQIGRTSFGHRRAVVSGDREAAIATLTASLSADVSGAGSVSGADSVSGEKSRPPLVFLYPGQGSQYSNMCRGLYEQEEVFRREADRCFDCIREQTGTDLRPIVFGEQTPAPHESPLDQTQYTQPALFIMEYALTRLLLSWGIRPDRTIGHSIGEYVSACIGGLFSLEDALGLVVKRGQLMQSAPAGAMASVDLDEATLREALRTHPGVTIAAVNSSSLCVVSGEAAAVAAFSSQLEAEGRRVKPLRTSHGFHCHLMDGILAEFGAAVRSVTMGEITIPWISNLTGRTAEAAEVSRAEYWMEHLRRPVLFGDGIGGLLTTQNDLVLLEVGPGRALSTLVGAHASRGEGHRVIRLVRSATETTGTETTAAQPTGTPTDLSTLLNGLGQLWMAGIPAHWPALHAGAQRRRVPLPAYSFERTAYPVLVDAFKMIDELVSSKVKAGEWYYVPAWHRRPLPEGIGHRPAGRTLILCDEQGIGRGLATQLQEQGEEVICTENEAEAYSRLGEVDRIIHAWGIQGESLSREQSCDLYFYSLTRLVKAAQSQGGLGGKEIVVLTSDLHPIVGGESGSPYKALSQGMLKVLSQENPTLITSHIDLTLKEAPAIGSLLAELQVQEKGKLVGYRNGRRWVQGYHRLATTGNRRSLREGGLYVVTGGLGKLGYELSRYLLDRYQAKVALLGRGAQPLDADKAKRLSALEQLGAVSYTECDIADEAGLRSAIAEVEERWGRINGVIHAAGITRGRSIEGLTPVQDLGVEDFALQFGPKIEGLEALKAVLGDRELDFCLLTSSLSAILGGLGFGAYAPANSYMDAYIQGHRDRGELTNWVSVNLDGLNFRDRERDEKSLNNQELREVVEEVLSMTEQPQVIVSKGDLQRRLLEWVTGREEEQQQASGYDQGAGVDGEDTTVGTSTERKLHSVWREFFGREKIGLDDDFFEIGGDSLKALTLIGRMNKALDAQVPVTEFFKRPSIRQLAEYITIVHRDSASETANPAEAWIEPTTPDTETLNTKTLDMETTVELDEPLIRRMLLQHPRVDDAIAFIHDYNHKGKYSIAFVLPNGIISTRKLKAFLAVALPPEQMPDYIIKCDQWPLDAEGAIDKKLLAAQAYAGTISHDFYVEPRTDLERRVAVLWREITGASRVSLNDTFFDIGGTPAQLEQVNKAVGRTFSVELPLSVYQTFSLQQVASRLTRAFKPVLENA